jgi:hypothetical protein
MNDVRASLLRSTATLLLASGPALLSCADLPDVEHDVCGNGVVDPHEDCDSFPKDGSAALSCGAPDTSAACKYVVSDASACPAGYVAGIDLVCRKATSSFVASVDLPNIIGTRPEVADFDGDGIGDVTALPPDRFKREVHFMNDGSERGFLELASLPGETAAIADLNKDGIADIVSPSNLGIATFLGTSDGSFTPELYSRGASQTANARFVALPGATHTNLVPPDSPLDWPGWIGGDGKGGVVLCFDGLAPQCTTAPLPGVAEADLAHFDARVVDLGDPVRSLAYVVDASPSGMSSSKSLFVVRFGAAPETVASVVEMKLPAKLLVENVNTIAGKLGVTDVDGDGLTDLVVAARVGANKKTMLFAYLGKTGLGSWQATDALSPVAVTLNLKGAPLLAAGDFNGDGEADFAANDQVWLSVKHPLLPPDYVLGPSSSLTADPNDANPPVWSEATTGDFNGDGITDVALLPPSPGVDLFLGARTGMAPFRLSSDAPLRSLGSDDIDGDGLPDIVASTAIGDIGTCDVSEQVLAYFGRSSAGPEGPWVLADVPGVTQVGLTHLFDSLKLLSPTGDSIADLAVINRPATGNGCSDVLRGSALYGASDRRPSSPYALANLTLPTSVAVGPIDASGTQGIVAFARAVSGPGVTFLARSEDGTLAQQQASLLGSYTKWRDHDYATGLALGPGGTVLAWTPRPTTDGCKSCDWNLEVHAISPAGTDQLVDLGPSGPLVIKGGAVQALQDGVRVVATGVEREVKDGDAPDFVGLVRIPTGNAKPAFVPPDKTTPVPENLFILRGSSYTPERPVAATPFVDFAMVHDAEGLAHVVVANATNVLLYDAKTSSMKDLYSLKSSGVDTSAVKITGLAAGDVDGDHLEDLLVVTTQGTRVLKRLATTDRDKADLTL